MSAKSKELRQQRHEKYRRMKALNQAAVDGKRDMTEAEQREYETLNEEISKLGAEVTKEEAPELRSQRLSELEGEMNERSGTRPKGSPEDPGSRAVGPTGTPEYRSAFRDYLAARDFSKLSADSVRALSVGSAADGGIMVPEATLGDLIAILRNANVMRGLAKVITVNGDKVIPFQSGKAVSYWVAEGKPATLDDQLKFKGSRLGSHKMMAEALFSNELLEDVAQPIEGFVADELGKSMGETEELAFIKGSGVGTPRGVVNEATDSGVTFASATAITPDELFDVAHALPRYYRKNATWLLADQTVKAIRKFKATTNQYLGLWQAGLEAGAPDILLGKPVVVTDNVDAVGAGSAGLKTVLFGDFSYYIIVDRVGRSFQRLIEKYAENDQVAILARQRVDGDLVKKDAVIFATQHS